MTLNGKVTIPMVFDTGAGILSLGAADAAKAGLVPSPSDRTITLHVADGSSHEAKMMTLDSVRVGKFTVRNVECAVSSKEKSNVPPLLGGPFLKHFTFKMNQAAGTVTFTKIETPEATRPRRPSARGRPSHLRDEVGRPGRRPPRPPRRRDPVSEMKRARGRGCCFSELGPSPALRAPSPGGRGEGR